VTEEGGHHRNLNATSYATAKDTQIKVSASHRANGVADNQNIVRAYGAECKKIR